MLGDLCTGMLIDNWMASNPNSAEAESLLALQATPMFNSINSGCKAYVDTFNEAAGRTCLLQEANPGVTYSDFWQIGPANMNADWSISVDMLFSANFTTTATVIPCANSCYSKPNGVPGCMIGKQFLNESNFGKIPQERVCTMGWPDLDNAYNALRLCGTKLVGNPANGTLEEMVAAYELQAESQRQCSAKACDDAATLLLSSSSSSSPATAFELSTSLAVVMVLLFSFF